MPRSRTPTVPPESHHIDSFVLVSGSLKPSPTAFVFTNGAESPWRGTSPLRPTVFLVYASQLSFIQLMELLQLCNTQYGLLVRLCPAGTHTLQEAPSCTWRTNDMAEPPGQTALAENKPALTPVGSSQVLAFGFLFSIVIPARSPICRVARTPAFLRSKIF